MPNSPIDPRQEMVRLYVEENLSVREIATRFDVSYGKVYSTLRKSVVMRGRGGRRRQAANHRQIAESIRESITTGGWRPGDKIPSRLELACIYDATDHNIKEAIAQLQHLGYLLSLPGRGTFVRPKQDWNSSGSQP